MRTVVIAIVAAVVTAVTVGGVAEHARSDGHPHSSQTTVRADGFGWDGKN